MYRSMVGCLTLESLYESGLDSSIRNEQYLPPNLREIDSLDNFIDIANK